MVNYTIQEEMIINYDFELNHRTRIVFGAGSIKRIGYETSRYGDRVLIVTDSGLKNLGIIEAVESSLKDQKMQYVIYDEVLPNPRDTGCVDAMELGKSFGANVIIGLGGGSAMDTAKASSVLWNHGEDCDKWAALRKLDEPLIPVICVPTTSGTGSEVTYEAVISSTKSNKKVSISDGAKLAPKVAVLDPELTLSVPKVITASTGMDALTHAIEAYTCLYAQPITDGLALYAMEKIAESIVTATDDGSNLRAREDMMIGSLMAGMAFTNSYLGAVHAFSEIIGGYYDIPHGIANSIFLPYVTEYNMSADYEKHSIVARQIGVDVTGLSNRAASERGVEYLFELNDSLKIPKFHELDVVNPKDFLTLSELCNDHNCGKKANPKKISTEDYYKIFNKAYYG